MEVSAIKHMGVAGAHGRSPLLRLQSDERLVALVRRGNQHAFEALVARYQSRLLAFCRHMLSSREDAEDVLQEVFAAAFNAMVADDRPINVRPWLYRIARNRSLNHLRRVPAVGVDSMDTHLSEHGLSTAEKVHRREDFRLLITDVQDLPETQRTALLLREIDALSYEQIAEAMDNTVPSVKSLLVRARMGLAEAAEARQLDCDEVRYELGEVAEGLKRMSSPVRRHLRACERCASFNKQLASTNRALAALLPVGPLFLLKKALVAQLGTTAAASSSAAAGSAAAGGAIQVGASAVATKAAAGLAAAAIVTAGAVEVRQVAGERPAAQTTVTASASPAVPQPVAHPDPDPVLPPAAALPLASDPVGSAEATAADDERKRPEELADEREEQAEAAEDEAAATAELADAAVDATLEAEEVAAIPVDDELVLAGAPATALLPAPPTEAVVRPSNVALGSPVTGAVAPSHGPAAMTPLAKAPTAPAGRPLAPLPLGNPAPAPVPADPVPVPADPVPVDPAPAPADPATGQQGGEAPAEPAPAEPAEPQVDGQASVPTAGGTDSSGSVAAGQPDEAPAPAAPALDTAPTEPETAPATGAATTTPTATGAEPHTPPADETGIAPAPSAEGSGPAGA